MDKSIITNGRPKVIVEGVTYDEQENSFTFDFKNDSSQDIIRLTNHGLYKSTIYNNCFYFKYQFEPDSSKPVRAKFIEYIKFHKDMKDYDIATFIRNAVDSLDDAVQLRSFGTVVYPQSISEVNREMIAYLRMFGYPEFVPYPEESIKLKNKKVVIIDDIKTSTELLNCIIDKIHKSNPSATVVVFSLIGKP